MIDPAGPLARIDVAAEKFPLYVVQFNEKGDCIAPKTRAAFLADLSGGQYTHVLFFSHGWNNDWEYTTTRYKRFLEDFHALSGKHSKRLPSPYKPIFIGIFWPSISLLLPWEEAPVPATAASPVTAAAPVAAAAANDPELAMIASLLNDEMVKGRFYELAGSEALLNVQEARELAEIFVEISKQPLDDVTQTSQSLTADDVLAAWRSAPSPAAVDSGDGLSEPDVGVASGSPEEAHAAGLLDYLDPRWIVRLGTVRIMKDRAGVVGKNGVATFLNDILGTSGARVHAIGHSYGAKVLLSAASGLHTGKLTSLLLLQPAVSYLCFSKNIGSGVAGGYSTLSQKIALPVFATFSSNDFPLSNVYHYALRRVADLGEVQIAAEVPSRYAALGGYGPPLAAGEMVKHNLPDAGTGFPAIPPQVRIAGFDSTKAISGHGDVLNDAVYWALLQQIA